MNKKENKFNNFIEDEFLTTTQAAKFCNVTRFTIRNWANEGKLKIKQTKGGHRRIFKDDLIKFISDNGIAATLPSDNPVLIPHCYDHKKFRNSDQHDCQNCLVYREKAGKCFLLTKEFGSKKVECKDDCLTCEYMTIYYPDDQKMLNKDSKKKPAKVRDTQDIPKCYDLKELVSSDEHDCGKCLVHKEQAGKCFLVIRQFGDDKVQCEHDCVHCAYMQQHYPREWNILLEVHGANVDKKVEKVIKGAKKKVSKVSKAQNSEKVKSGLYKSGKYFASMAKALNRKKSENEKEK
jgi:excisionase family DNA binding protein